MVIKRTKNCCHFWINFAHIPVLRNRKKRVITAVFDPFTLFLPQKWILRLKNWTKRLCMVIKRTEKIWAFVDHFCTLEFFVRFQHSRNQSRKSGFFFRYFYVEACLFHLLRQVTNSIFLFGPFCRGGSHIHKWRTISKYCFVITVSAHFPNSNWIVW